MSAPLSLIVDNIVSTLVARRKRLGLSQEQVAQQLGMKKQNFRVWEIRGQTPIASNLVKWARALDVEVRLIPYEGTARRASRTN